MSDKLMNEELINHVSENFELLRQCQLFHYDIDKFTPRNLAIAAIEAVQSYKEPDNAE